MIKNILFPTDFSEISLNALSYALVVARSTEARLVLLHTYNIPDTDSEMLDDMLIIKDKKARNRMNSMRKQIESYPENGNVTIDTMVVEGDLIHEINRAAVSISADLVIAGSHKPSRTDMIMGTNTSLLIKECICPVLVIPENTTFSDIRKIVFAKDLDRKMYDQHIIDELAEIFHSDVDLLEFRKDSVDYSFYPRTMTDDGVITNPYTSGLEEGLTDFVNQVHPQMFVMISDEEEQTEAMNAGVTKKLASSFNIPLLALSSKKMFVNRVSL